MKLSRYSGLTVFAGKTKVQTSMKNILGFFWIACAITLTFNQSQAAPAANGKTALRVSVELKDGSYVIGQSLDSIWLFRSALLGGLRLGVANIASVQISTNNGSARLTTVDNDQLNVKFITAFLRVETSFGKTELPVKTIRNIVVSAANDLVPNTPNLLGYWRFDPVYQANSCVNDYTGTLQGNAQIGAPGSGHLASGNQALMLDGDNSYLTTSLTGQIENQGTILTWVYLTALPSDSGHIFELVSQSQYGNDFALQIEPDNQFHFYTDSGSATVAPALPLNQWHFLAATFTANSTRSIYLDGQLVASGTCGGHYLNSNPFWFGNDMVFGPRCFQGRLDNVAIFNRALSAGEIQGIYAGQK